MSEIGIMTIQKMASQPFTRRMNTGSPCTMAHSDFMPVIDLLLKGYARRPALVMTCPIARTSITS